MFLVFLFTNYSRVLLVSLEIFILSEVYLYLVDRSVIHSNISLLRIPKSVFLDLGHVATKNLLKLTLSCDSCFWGGLVKIYDYILPLIITFGWQNTSVLRPIMHQ